MTEAKPAEAKPHRADEPVVHRICEACNNMFVTRPSEKERRCPNCKKE